MRAVWQVVVAEGGTGGAVDGLESMRDEVVLEEDHEAEREKDGGVKALPNDAFIEPANLLSSRFGS